MTKIILKSGLTVQQKYLLEGILLALLILILEIVKAPTDYRIIALYLFVFIAVILIFILISKNGLLLGNGKLYKTKYIFKKYWFKRKVCLKNITDITILSFNNVEEDGYDYQIFLLNSIHTFRHYLISTKDDLRMARQTVHQINDIINLQFTKYKPKYKKYRRR